MKVRYRFLACAGLALALALAGTPASATGVVTASHCVSCPQEPLNFCRAFNELQENNILIPLLDEELAAFISLLGPNTADINGAFSIDDSGDDLILSLEGNGIRDGANELGIIAEVLTNPDAYPGDGPMSHNTLHAAWTANKAQIEADLGSSLDSILATLLPELKVILIGYMMLGDGDFTVTSAEPIVVEGTGSFGFVGALFALLNSVLADEGFPLIENPDIDINDYSPIPQLLAGGDADGDGFSNLCEARYFERTLCDGNEEGVTDYVTAALDMTITPDGCFEDVSRCDVPLSGSAVVPPIVSEGLGNVKILELYNSTLDETRYDLSLFHTVTYATRASVRVGGPTENGVQIIGFGNASLPYDVTLTDAELYILRELPSYVSILRNPPPEGEIDLPESEDVRGNIECDFGENPVAANYVCSGSLSQASVVPPVTAVPERMGEFTVYILPDGQLYGTLWTDLPGPAQARLFEGGVGVNGTLIAELGKPQGRNGFAFGTTLTVDQVNAAASGDLYLDVTSGANPDGHMRGQLTCTFVGTEGEGEGEGVHSADQNGDNQISLSELLRVIQFFNSDGYSCAVPPDSTEDGYAAGPGNTSCVAHSSDYAPQDFVINLSELLRLIQFFNTGGYNYCPLAIPPTEDGYCPGLPLL